MTLTAKNTRKRPPKRSIAQRVEHRTKTEQQQHILKDGDAKTLLDGRVDVTEHVTETFPIHRETVIEDIWLDRWNDDVRIVGQPGDDEGNENCTREAKEKIDNRQKISIGT